MKGSRLYFELFKVYRDVVESGSFSKAAELNFVTQSAVSQQMTFLERHFGKQFFDRGRGRFSLTTEGELFYHGIEKMMDEYQNIIDSFSDENMAGQTVNIEAVYSIGFYSLNPIVRLFLEDYKQINLHIEYGRSDKIYSDIIHRLYDFGVVAFPWSHPLITIYPWKKEELVFICNPNHPLSDQKQIILKDLNDESYIAFIKEIPTRAAIEKILFDKNVKVNIVREFGNIETLKRAVEVGDGVSLVPNYSVKNEVRNKDLVAIPIKDKSAFRETGIITRKDQKISKATAEVIRYILNN